ncbi:MAG: hypothetical protein IJU61_05405 [Victivallales bacterium]|nr:hypothetical protein [Victivallales bacterium]
MRLFKGPIHYGRELPGHPFNITALLTRIIIAAQRKIFCESLKTARMRYVDFDATTPDDSQKLISAILEQPEPALVARYGTGELETTLRGLDIDAPSCLPFKLVKMFCGRCGPFWWDNSIRSGIHWIAGVFPPDNATMMRFAHLVDADSREIDLLVGGRAAGEQFMRERRFPNGKGIPNDCFIRPDSPVSWTHNLKDKRVLVVSPFDASIRVQHERRKELFPNNPSFLPHFDLITYRPVVSFAGEFANLPYKDWFEALDKMEHDIAAIDFDIALISAGAYGMNLGARIKRMGRKAVHVGGILQAMFGLKFRGTDEVPYWRQFYTDAWTRPQTAERPKNYMTVENGSYW